MRPGLPNQGVVGPRGAAVVPKPGVIRGPAAAMRMTRPANVVFNPRHRVGLAGLNNRCRLKLKNSMPAFERLNDNATLPHDRRA